MANFLRSDWYRLRRSGVLAGVVLFLLAVPAVLSLGCLAVALVQGDDVGGWRFGSSFVDMGAGMGFVSGMLSLTAAYAPVSLVSYDWRTGACKTTLAARGARRDYVLSKVAVGALCSFILPAVTLVGYLVFPMIAGVPYETAPGIAVTLQWWLFASLVCLGYATLGTLLALISRGETMAWVLAIAVGLGMAGSAVQALLGGVAALWPVLADAATAVADGMLLTQASAVGAGTSFVEGLTSAVALRAALVPIAWTVACTAAGYLAFRRRRL